MSLACFLERWTAESDPLYACLSLALTKFFTAALLAVQLLIGLSARYGHGSQQHQTFSKGANR